MELKNDVMPPPLWGLDKRLSDQFFFQAQFSDPFFYQDQFLTITVFPRFLTYDIRHRVGEQGISGTLTAVDQFLNLKLEGVAVNEDKCPRPQPSPLGPSKTTPVYKLHHTACIVLFLADIFSWFLGSKKYKFVNEILHHLCISREKGFQQIAHGRLFFKHICLPHFVQ